MVNSWATIKLEGKENITKGSRKWFKKLISLTMLTMEKIQVYLGQK
jgi:hypothetical protein